MTLSSAAGRPAERSRAVGAWLATVAIFVFLMVVVGGATRLTGSGLSITEWKPISGAIPPLSGEAWARAFAQYRASSQYRLINLGISLQEFKFLFWWEWAHRLLGRSIGLVFAAPMIGFLALGRMPERLVGRCLALFVLGGLQGAVGWWMVKSGLEGRASVAPERLAAHLGLALLLFVALIWTALDALAGPPGPMRDARSGWRLSTGLFALGVFIQCLMGALVAGTGGGRINTDWPRMGGRWFPEDYWQGGIWATFVHGRAAVQFDHRLLAYGLLVLGFGMLLVAVQSRASERRPPIALTVAAVALLMLQAGLGIATLIAGDPLWLALTHQANAVILLGVAVGQAWVARRRYFNTVS
jgi:cytochrome c oxidase assembly protein subunit 15